MFKTCRQSLKLAKPTRTAYRRVNGELCPVFYYVCPTCSAEFEIVGTYPVLLENGKPTGQAACGALRLEIGDKAA